MSRRSRHTIDHLVVGTFAVRNCVATQLHPIVGPFILDPSIVDLLSVPAITDEPPFALHLPSAAQLQNLLHPNLRRFRCLRSRIAYRRTGFWPRNRARRLKPCEEQTHEQ
jgi:hypothetical protein